MGRWRRKIEAVVLAALAAGPTLLWPFDAPAQSSAPLPLPVAAPAPTAARPATAPSTAATTTAATTTAATTSAATITDPAIVLRAPNVPQPERDEAARRLLMQRTPEGRKAIAAALSDTTNRRGQLAAARAILVDPDPDQAFINPLFELIGPDAALTDAAIGALANYRSQPDVAKTLIRLALDPQQQQRDSTQVSAIRAVGTMPNKSAARVLMELLVAENETPAIRNAAAAALSDMTAAGFVRSDPAYWQRWWAENQKKPDTEFERDLLDARGARLVRLQNRFDRFVGETRAILEELYQRTPEKEKESILLRYLRSSEPETRALGAKIVQDDFKQTRPITPVVRDQLRAMVGDNAAQVRIAVAQALLLLNDAQALDALLAQLAREPDPDVRMELARALVPMRDLRVVDPLVKLLRDPSPAVAEVAARGLGSEQDLAPLIRNDPQLSLRVALELRGALDRANAPPLRASIVDAMGALRNPNLLEVYRQRLAPNEPVVVRRAALRALGQFGKPGGQTWPAEHIADALARDPDDSVRQEAVRALKTTADFAHAPLLYDVISARDSSPTLRDEAWGVLRNLFSDPTATNAQLAQFADRFKNQPERRIEVLRVLAERLTAMRDEKSQENLASVRQTLGAEYKELARRAAARADLDAAAREQAVIDNAKQADMYFDLALKHYRASDPIDQKMTTSDLLERRMDALLASKQYQSAADFAASSIAANSGNHESMARKLRIEAERLRQANHLQDALELIKSTKTMKPPLADVAASRIEEIEAEISKVQNPPPPSDDPQTTPRSAVGSGQ